MKKRNQPQAKTEVETLVPEEIRQLARKSIESDRPMRVTKQCVVCGSGYTPMSGPQPEEELCWVCRRLKISAWRESDQQAALQE